MAFTETQKTAIRRYLGYPDIYRYRDTRLEGLLDGALSATAETAVIADLALCDAASTKLFGTTLDTAGVKRVEDIEFFENKSMIETRNSARSASGRISITLGVPFFADFWGTDGYPGDQYTEATELRPAGGRGQYEIG